MIPNQLQRYLGQLCVGVLVFLAACFPTRAALHLASAGTARCPILTQPGATAAERHAAEELAAALLQITGASFAIQEAGAELPANAIVIGPGPVSANLFPEADLAKFGGEEYLIRVSGGRMLLAGGRPRGTLYAVYRFLQDQLGVRYYTPWFTKYPAKPNLSVSHLNLRGRPAFEYRDPFWFPAFDGDWAARNGSNSQSARLTDQQGGQIIYKGFVHTFYGLVPPDQYFKTHPEWFSLVKGKRTGERAQLCTTDPALRDFIVQRVKEWLRETPNANLISVSQNDHAGACECPRCAAIDEREGTHAGSVLELVNYVAERIEADFPRVQVDTLAYQHTRRAPKTLRPRRNVVIRLCSIECNFAQPLTHASNHTFRRDIEDWHRLTDRLYVWDYTTDFSHYLLPFPNWYILGDNARFFHRNGVVGLFEQGAYQSFSGEMSELRAWVLAQLLWNPYQNEKRLISEFLDAYYGPDSARYIRQYFDLVSRKAQPFYVGIGHPDASPFLRFDTLSAAEGLWQKAEAAAREHPDRLWRVRQAHLPIGYLWLSQWTGLRREAAASGLAWPIDASRRAYATAWLATVNDPGPPGWSPMTTMRESGQVPAQFVAGLANDPDESLYQAPTRHAASEQVTDLSAAEQRSGVSVQDDCAILFREAECSRVLADAAASDGVAIRMIAGTNGARGALEIHGAKLPAKVRSGRYDLYYIVKVETQADARPDASAFSARVYDHLASKYVADRMVTIAETKPGYHAYRVGTIDLNPYIRLWLGHAQNPTVQSVWFDQAVLVPAPDVR